MQRKMVEGRQQKIEELQRHAWEAQTDQNPEERMENLELDAPAWESLRNAPVWPIRRSSLLGIIAIDAIPVLLSVMPS